MPAHVPTPAEPFATSEQVRRRMQGQARRDTRPEVELWRALWRRGFRYRVDAPLPLSGVRRRADLLFPSAKVVVFVDGCFWHACPVHGNAPRVNQAYWGPKLARNVERDRETDALLGEAGWQAVRVWEHEDSEDAATLVADVLCSRESEQLTDSR